MSPFKPIAPPFKPIASTIMTLSNLSSFLMCSALELLHFVSLKNKREGFELCMMFLNLRVDEG